MKLRQRNTFLGGAVLMLLLAAPASGGTIRIALHDTTIVGGTQFNYPVYLDSSVTGLDVISYQLEVSYNNTVFTFLGAQTGGTLTSGWTQFDTNSTVTNSITKVSIAGSGAVALTGTGKLVILTFQATIYPYNTSSSITLQNATLNEGSPPNVLKNGSVSINSPPVITISPDTWLMTKGETKQFSINGGTAPYAWSLTNTGVGSISASGLLTATQQGSTRVVCVDGVSTVDTSGVVEIRALSISIRDTSRYQGQSLLLPIMTTSVTGLGITSGQFTITYNPNYWTPESLITTGTMLNGWYIGPLSPLAVNASQSSINVAFSSASQLSGSGILLYVKMKASETNYGSPTLSFSNILFNESILSNSSSGYVTVQKLNPLSISPGGTHSILVGDSIQFSATGGTPAYMWSVSDTARASISASGWLKGKKSGTVTATAQDQNGATGTSGAINIYDISVSVPDSLMLPRDTVDVPIFVSPSMVGYSAVQMKATYSTSAPISLIDVISTGTLISGWSLDKVISAGSVVIASGGVSTITTGGILLKLRFLVSNAASIPSTVNISLSDVVFNQGLPLPLVDNGYFTLANNSRFGITPLSGSISTPAIGKKDSAIFTVKNSGTVTLTGSISIVGSSEFTLSTGSLSVPSGGTTSVTLYYLPTNGGSDNASIHFTTNDPYNLSVSVPITGSVVIFPTISINKTTIAFGSVKNGQFKDTTVTITNGGTDTLKITSITANIGVFTSKKTTATVLPGASFVDTLRFAPTAVTTYSGRFLVVSNAASSPDTIKVTGTGTTSLGVVAVENLPSAYALLQNYPNPFNPTTSIEYSLPQPGMITLTVYNIIGEEVAVLVDGYRSAGTYSASFDARQLSSGVYYYLLKSDNFSAVRKMMLLK